MTEFYRVHIGEDKGERVGPVLLLRSNIVSIMPRNNGVPKPENPDRISCLFTLTNGERLYAYVYKNEYLFDLVYKEPTE
jgi:hypothetical protein